MFALPICLVACHGGPGAHFVVFAEQLSKAGYEVQVFASGTALKNMKALGVTVEPFDVDDPLEVARIAKKCAKAAVVLTDVGLAFAAGLQRELAAQSPQLRRLAYYDNPEPYVPGYSKNAAEVMLEANGTLFANRNLATEPIYREKGEVLDLPFSRRIGLGYYPVDQAEKVIARRAEEHGKMRTELFSRHQIEDKGQKVLVYFGGNNSEYFDQAFPEFLQFLSEGVKSSDLSNTVIVLQQHPGAREKNIDCKQIEAWMEKNKGPTIPKILISDQPSDVTLVVADGALYYQTSMAPLFVLAGIPTIQVGHETYPDVVVKGGLAPSATDARSFIKYVENLKREPISEANRQKIYASLGINEHWFETLKRALTTPW